jgi:predicted Rossmann fold nucleotide-binding protein DprA/Smf involved in DNA uptake
MAMDDVVRRTNLAASVVAGALAMLELKGLVRLADGAQYSRAS